MKVLVDTCIVIDALQSRAPFAEDAQNIFLAAASDQCEAYLTAKEITDVYYLSHRILHSKNKTERIMSKLFSLFAILDTKAEDVEQALASQISDYEDAVMVQTAIREKMECIVTRNPKDYKNAKINVYSPKEFLSVIDFHSPDA